MNEITRTVEAKLAWMAVDYGYSKDQTSYVLRDQDGCKVAELKKHPRFNILVSSCGRFIVKMETEHIYKQYRTKKGYMRVEFRHKQNGITKREKQLVHRLVAETWVDRPKYRREVDHIDRNRENNDHKNLRWVNRKQNVRNSSAYKHGKYIKKRPNINKIKKERISLCDNTKARSKN